MSISKNKLIFWLINLICLSLWVITYRLIAFFIITVNWFWYIKNQPFKIKRTIKALLIFISIFILSIFVQFKLTTTFYQPCWSPDGKQIAFFMNRRLVWSYPGYLGPEDIQIWSKNYLCTMDYNGKEFKKLMKTKYSSRYLSWNMNNSIIYGYDNDIWKINLNNLKEEKVLEEKSLVLDLWLSKDERYIGYILNYRLPYISKDGIKRDKDKYKLVIKDLMINKDNIIIDQKYDKYSGYGRLYGAYDKNIILYEEPGEDQWMIYKLDTGEKEIVTGKLENIKLPATLDLRVMSPDRTMYTEGSPSIWRSKDNKLLSNNKLLDSYIKDKRSYLLNIFWR